MRIGIVTYITIGLHDYSNAWRASDTSDFTRQKFPGNIDIANTIKLYADDALADISTNLLEIATNDIVSTFSLTLTNCPSYNVS